MKKFLILVMTACALLMGTRTASAQDWQDLLKKAASAADEALGGKVSELTMNGRWVYSAPAMKMKGDDVMSGLAAAALEKTAEKKMAKIYEKVGLKPGIGILTLNRDNRYEATTGERTVKGDYTYEAEQHLMTFSFDSKRRKYDPVTGTVYVRGNEMILVFPVTKLVDMVKAIGDRVPQLNGLAALFEHYKDVYVGFTFRRDKAVAIK